MYSAKGHSEIINCIDGVGGLGIGEGAPEIATGSRDGITIHPDKTIYDMGRSQCGIFYLILRFSL